VQLNQFAIQPVDYQTIKKELAAIGFLPLTLAKDPKKMFQQLLTLSVPEQTAIAQVFDKLLATDQMTLAQFFASAQPLTVEVFYTVALQLLSFQVPVDFTGSTVLADAKKIGIRTVSELSNRQAMLTAWYELLNTHTKKGLTFLDDLASRGFYEAQSIEKPLFFNGKAQAVFDTQGLIREVVYVETPLDTDQDGQRDLIKVEVIRPNETNSGLQVPALYTASPYNQGTNPELGEKAMHEMNVPLTRKTPNQVTVQDITYQAPPVVVPPISKAVRTVRQATETFTNEKAVVLNDYLLARGFAAVYSAGIGTRDSDGIQTCGSVEQTIATVAVVEWLAGNRQAFTDHTRQTAIKAWWCNGQVAMTGKSYLGTLAIAAATTGVPGLATIISEAAISNWYQYYRDNGLVVSPGGFPGEDADVLAIETMSRMQDAGDYLKVKAYFEKSMTAMQTAQDRLTGDYNLFWVTKLLQQI
jgi:X-Pro dipeptidyl-peptidase